MEEYPPHDGVKRDTDGGEEQPIAEDLDGFDLDLDEFMKEIIGQLLGWRWITHDWLREV